MSIAWSTVEAAIHAWVVASSGLSADNVIWSGQNSKRPTVPYIALRMANIQRIGYDWLEAVDNPLVIADDTVESVNATTNVLTLTAHGLLTGDGPIRFTTTGTWTGMTGVDFWVIKTAANTIKLAASFPDSINLAAFDITSAGTGTHTLVDTATTARAGQEILMRSRGQRDCTLNMQCFAAEARGNSSAMALLNKVVSGSNLETRRAAFVAAGIGLAKLEGPRFLDGLIGSIFEPRAILEAKFFLAEEVSEATTFIQYVELENLTTAESTYIPEDPNP